MDALSPWFRLIPLLAAAASCTAASSTSGSKDSESESVDDSGTDSETDTDTGFFGASVFPITEDLLPDWSMAWAKVSGGSGGDAVGGLAATGPDTFVAFCATTDSEDPFETISFDGITVPVGPENMLLVKYNIEGKVQWATWAGDGAHVSGGGIDALEDGRIAVAGWSGNAALFGPGELNETLLSTGIDDDYNETSYFAVYESDGTLAWVRWLLLVDQTFPQSRSECLAVDILDVGSVLAAGQFDGSVVAGDGTPMEITLVRDPDGEQNAYNAFIVKYDADGNLLWARREGGPGKTVASGLAAMPDGSFFLAGGFEGAAVFGAGQANETTLVSSGTESVFLGRFDSDGNLEWVTDLGVQGYLSSWKKTGRPLVLSNGDVAIPGSFHGSMLVGDGEDVAPVEAQAKGLFLARYTTGGDRVWTRVAYGDEQAGGDFEAVSELHDGLLAVAGYFKGTVNFGAGEPNETLLMGNSGSSWDALLCTYSAAGDFLWALPQGSSGWETFRGLARFAGESSESDILIAGGGFSSTVTFGTGGDDTVSLTATESEAYIPYDIVLLRFDREAE